VETLIDQLLSELEPLIGENEMEKYKEALEQAKTTRVAQEKIALVRDLLPALCKPNGMNPLAVLHDQLSCGLHNETDEECLEIAEAVRKSLVFLLKRVREGREEAGEFTEATRKLLDRKGRKRRQEND
jgi:hypothetical protein